jgi:hypothetical protein
MPEMTEGPSNEPSGRPVKAVWATLTEREAQHLLESLENWRREIDEGFPDSGWHTHVEGDDGTELTIAVALDDSTTDIR